MNRSSRRSMMGLREHRSSVLVAALSAAFGVVLLRLTTILATVMTANQIGQFAAVRDALSVLASVFIIIAVYVSAIVTTNTFATVIAGRTRMIALLRLIGSSATTQRRAVAREGLAVGTIGGLAGAVAGLVMTSIGVGVMVATGVMPDLSYGFADTIDVLPVVVVVLTTWLASWVGSRRVLAVSPMQAVGAQQELSQEASLRRTGRNVTAILLFAAGLLLLALGIVVGMASPLGLVIAALGGAVSFTGVVLGAHLIMPSVLRLSGRAFGRSAPARLASANAVRYPERSTRTTIGLVIGVTLVTMFAVAEQSFDHMISSEFAGNAADLRAMQNVLGAVFGIFSGLVGFSGVIAGVGMVNNLSLNVLQRTRELGLLRALGFTSTQIRKTIMIESAQTVLAATVTGLILGVFYGWAGAQSLVSSVVGDGRLLPPSIPWVIVVVVFAAAAVLSVSAAAAPTRRATRVSPIVALAVD